MIKDFLMCLFALVVYTVIQEFDTKNPIAEKTSNGITRYCCPICKSPCSYFWYDATKENKDISVEIRCEKYCSECGAKLKYKKINNRHEKVIK